MQLLGFAFFVAFSVSMLYAGLWMKKKIRRVQAAGKLYDAKIGESVLFNAIPYSVIKFNDSVGLEVEWPGPLVFVFGRGASGTSVSVLYDPENPSVILRPGFPYQILSWFLIIVGGFFTFNFGLGLLIFLVAS